MLALLVGGIVFIYALLGILLHLTQDAREPPAIETSIPFVSPILGMMRQKSRYYVRLRDTYRLPIYTLRLPFSHMYVVNATDLIPALQKHWRTVSFTAFAVGAGRALGLSKGAIKLMQDDLTSEHGFSLSWPKHVVPAMSPGKDLDDMNRMAIQVLAKNIEALRASGSAKTGLWKWTRETMVTATTEAVWGPQNPWRDPAVSEAWRLFESGFTTLMTFPLASVFFRSLIDARETVASALIKYMRDDGHKTASGLVKSLYEHHVEQFGFSHADFARGELGNGFAVLGSSAPCALWVLYHVFSDSRVLEDVRREVWSMVEEDTGAATCSIELADIRTACPVLLSTFQETMRYRGIAPGPRVLLDDILLDGRYQLKKGSMLMIPTPVQHTDIAAWGNNAQEFDHLRFVGRPASEKKMWNWVVFRAFGGGHVLCPGRHFATTEIMALVALMVMQFDIVPVIGRWIEPTSKNSPLTAAFPIIDEDIEVELRLRRPDAKWDVKFSASRDAAGIGMEDMVRMED